MRLAVLTSGGDAPGMNACIRAVVRAAIDRDMEVVGVRRGFQGIFDRGFTPLGRADIVNIVQRGGTILGTSRAPRMRSDDGLAEAVSTLRDHRVDAMVLIGGDGTFRAGAALEAAGGPPTVGIPGTIDNDVPGTDVTLGFDTAVNTALSAIDRIRDTSTSHELLHFVEVMGRHCGALALAAGVAGGAEAVLVPEVPITDDELSRRIGATIDRGKRSVIVVVSEGARPGGTTDAAAHVGAKLGLDYRVTVLGHIQRGGSPTAADRILGATWGVEAVAAVAEGAHGLFVGTRDVGVVRAGYAQVGAPVPELDRRLTSVAELLA